MKTSSRAPESWQHGLPFFGTSLLLFAISLVFAFWGVSTGSSLLQGFNAGERPQLGTMGEVLGGTLAFAVAFAGAWVAFKIAWRANKIVGAQQEREASRVIHKTLEKSIGQILAMQLELEALVREVGNLARLVDSCCESGPETYESSAAIIKATAPQAELVCDQAQKVSKKMQQLLNDPRALAVVLAVGRAKRGDGPRDEWTKRPKDKEAQKRRDDADDHEILTELGQVPRLLDQLSDKLKGRNYVQRENARWGSAYDFVRIFLPEYLVELGLSDLADRTYNAEDALLVNELSFSCFLTAECEGPVSAEIREPSLWRALRAFVYTPSEAREALEDIFPHNAYRDELLQLGPARAFAWSGMTNDQQIAQHLRYCRRITEGIRRAVNRPECKQYTPPAVLGRLAVAELGLEPALTRAERLWDDLPKLGDERPSVRPVCSRLYAMLCDRCYRMCTSQWFRLPTFELYQCIYKTFRDYKSGVASEEFSVTSLLGDISRLVDVLAAQAKLHEKVSVDRTDLNDKGAIQEGVNRLAALAVQAEAADLLDGLEIPQAPALDELKLFVELQKGLNKRIVDRALGPLSSAHKADVGRLLEDAAVAPLQVQLAAQACARQGGAGEFETWLINQLRSGVTRQMQGVLCLAEVQALGGSGRVESDGRDFTVICEKLHGVPDFLASSVSIRSEAETAGFVSVEFRLPWFDEAGFDTVPHADAQLKLTDLMLLCGMLGYLKVDPEEKFSGYYHKSVPWSIDDLHWLRLALLELRLLASAYCEMAGESSARDAEETYLSEITRL